MSASLPAPRRQGALRNSGTVVDVTGKVKFGTADDAKGLGTGKNDYSIQLDLTQKLTDAITAFGSVGYKFVGSPSGSTLHDALYGEAGGAYKFTDTTQAGAILFVSEAIGTSPQRDVTAYLTQKLTANWKIQVYGVRGFADGSPDWGGGAVATLKF
jgi:hypothetical protein